MADPRDIRHLAASAAVAGSYYKDDPALIGTRLEPDFIYSLPSGDGTLKRMAQTYNAIGGLVDTLARRLGIDPVAVLAVWHVESGGRAFTPGRPVLRFESHKFFKYWGIDHEPLFDKHFQFGGHAEVPGRPYQNHRFRDRPSGPWRPVHTDQDREYEVFAFAGKLADREAACLSASFGGPQIMGFNSGSCGYSSASAMAEAFGADQRWQVLGFYDFCRSNNLIDEIQNKQWNAFGQKYNGDGDVYGPKLEDAFDVQQALLALPRIPNPPGQGLATGVRRAARRSAAKARRSAVDPKQTRS